MHADYRKIPSAIDFEGFISHFLILISMDIEKLAGISRFALDFSRPYRLRKLFNEPDGRVLFARQGDSVCLVVCNHFFTHTSGLWM